MHENRLRSVPIGVRLAETLRDRIVRGTIPAGTHLVEDRVAEEFDVSRGPVRDALRILSIEQLIEPVGRRGQRVIGLGPDGVRDLYAVRRGLESVAVTEVCRARTEGGLDALRRSVETMRDSTGDVDAFATSDLAFHRALYETSGNRRLLALWEQIEPLFSCILAITNSIDGDLEPVVVDHSTLLEIIASGDEQRAVDVLEEHLDGSRRRIITALEQVWAHSDGP